MAGLPQLQTFNLKDMDQSIQMEQLLRRMTTPTVPLAPRTAEDDAFDAWAARQGAEEAKVPLDEFGGTEPIYGDNDWLGGAAGLFGSLFSGYMGSRATNRATQTEIDALNRATETQRQSFEQARADLAPYRDRAAPARNQLAVMMGINPDVSSYGTRNPQQDPLWGSGYRTASQYKPNPQYSQIQGALSSGFIPQRGNPNLWTNAISNALAGMKK